MNNKKYLICCRHCGNLILKTGMISFFNTEIKCSQCKKLLKLPEDIIITKEKKKGLDKPF